MPAADAGDDDTLRHTRCYDAAIFAIAALRHDDMLLITPCRAQLWYQRTIPAICRAPRDAAADAACPSYATLRCAAGRRRQGICRLHAATLSPLR